MTEITTHKQMIKRVANALGTEWLAKVVFVGGCTTGLHITDSFTIEQIRHTDDVDLIVSLIGGTSAWHTFQQHMRKNGFTDDLTPDAPVCAMKLGELRVDFMPDDEKILGFSNRWYGKAEETAELYDLDGTTIRLVTPPYFVATKLEAFKGRGGNDPFSSQDIEDVLNLFDGRESLIDEIAQSPNEVRVYIAEELKKLLELPAMPLAIEATSFGDRGRKELLYERIEDLIKLGK